MMNFVTQLQGDFDRQKGATNLQVSRAAAAEFLPWFQRQFPKLEKLEALEKEIEQLKEENKKLRTPVS